jgi:glutathione synthase/RimK-type ligase-like ATP-grasp enzyme
VLEIIGTDRLALGYDAGPRLELDGAPLAHYDAVVPRLTARDGPVAIAAVRELEHMGSVALNPADAIERLGEPVAAMQRLTHRGIPVAPPSDDTPDTSLELKWARRRAHPVTRLLIVGGDVAGMAELRHGTMRDAGSRKRTTDRSLAVRAAKALGLGFASVDVVAAEDARAVARVSSAPDLGTLEKITGARIAETVVAEIESRARSWVRRPEPEADDGE